MGLSNMLRMLSIAEDELGRWTLRAQLESSPRNVSIAEFEASKGVGTAASWAVWGDKVGDLSVFDDSEAVVRRLRKDVVLIGANFGASGDGGEFATFKNFHARSSGGDSKLRNGVQGTVLEGAFLTDLVKDYPTKDASGLIADIKTGKLAPKEHVLEGFEAEQEALGLDRDTLYVPIGGTTRELWDFLVSEGYIPETQRVFHRAYGGGSLYRGKPVVNLRHYSSAVNMVEAVEALLSQPAIII